MTMPPPPSLCLDHVLSYSGAPAIEDALARYRAAGFAVMAQTVRHAPGLRNGFVGIGPEYLELLWVEDERAFGKSGPWRQAQRRARRPCTLALRTDDLGALQAAWRARGLDVGPATDGAPADRPGASPAWSFLHVPPPLLPGIGVFVLRYHAVDAAARGRVRAAPNGVYALAGVSVVAGDCEAIATRWRDVLAPERAIDVERGERRFALGPHALAWLTPDAFARRYGPFAPAVELAGEIALVHLWSRDLDRTEDALHRAGRATRRQAGRDGPELFVPADPEDGFAFAIAARPVRDWAARRHELTGEPITLADDAVSA
jgi:hypothetical protein